MDTSSISERIDQIRQDREHGSRWLVRESMTIMRDLADRPIEDTEEHMRLLYGCARELALARPAMAALSTAMGRIISVQGGPAAVAQEAKKQLKAYEQATQMIATYAKPHLYGQVMTCSFSGTVLDVLAACKLHIDGVIVLEGRPGYEGRTMARDLSERGLAVTLITDAQADIFMPSCQSVLVGADSVLLDGSVLNKAGTALLAWSALGQHVPFYVVCETLKISPQSWANDQAMLEEKEAAEVLDPPLPNVTVRNYYFDRTPASLVNKTITEEGIVTQTEIAAIARKAQQNLYLLTRFNP